MSTGSADTKGLFIHEMTHIWQSQQGVMTTVKGFFMHAGAVIKGFFKGFFFTNKSISQAIAEEQGKLYDITSGSAEPLGKYNIEQQATAVERNYTAGERQSAGAGISTEEKRAHEIMNKTPDFPNAKALE